jgi:hypothetical protein
MAYVPISVRPIFTRYIDTKYKGEPMGWLYSTRWQSSQEVLDWFKEAMEKEGYTVERAGHWFIAQDNKRGIIDLIYLKTAGGKKNGYGYKDMSVREGPYVFNAPVNFVKRIYPVLKDSEYFKQWFNMWREKHPTADFWK